VRFRKYLDAGAVTAVGQIGYIVTNVKTLTVWSVDKWNRVDTLKNVVESQTKSVAGARGAIKKRLGSEPPFESPKERKQT